MSLAFDDTSESSVADLNHLPPAISPSSSTQARSRRRVSRPTAVCSSLLRFSPGASCRAYQFEREISLKQLLDFSAEPLLASARVVLDVQSRANATRSVSSLEGGRTCEADLHPDFRSSRSSLAAWRTGRCLHSPFPKVRPP